MNAKRIVAGTLAGAVALYLAGGLIWGVLFADFFAANTGSATGVAREPQLWWAVMLGALSAALLLTLVIGMQRSAPTVMDGARIGAIVQFLSWLSVNLILYGATNSSNLTGALVDPVLKFIHGGIAGAVIAVVFSRVGAPVGREMQHA